MRLLLIKTSSLGDIVHTLPALTDAAGAVERLRVDWLVEAAFAEIPSWHPAVSRVLRTDLRAWRRHPLASRRLPGWRALAAAMAEPHDLVLDAQGLLKSAWLARWARGRCAGPGFGGAREPLAALFYQRRLAVPAHDRAHAIDRLRILFSGALGYPLPPTTADAGLRRGQFSRPAAAPRSYVVFLHGTSWASKRWPRQCWQALGVWLSARGCRAVLPWGSAAERAEAQAIAGGCDGVVLPAQTLTELAGWLAHADAFVGVDTGLSHLGAALGTPGATLYGPTLPALTGARGENQVHLGPGDVHTIDRQRPVQVDAQAVERVLSELLASPRPSA